MGRHAGFRGIRKRGIRLPPERSDEIWERFLEGLSLISAIEVSKLPEMPSAPAFAKKRRRDQTFARRADAIMAARRLHNGGRKRIPAHAWASFIEQLGKVCVRELCAQAGMPSEAAVYKRRKKDATFDAVFVASYRERRRVAIQAQLYKRFPGLKRLFDKSQDVGWSVHEEREKPVGQALQDSLRRNDLYQAVMAVVPAHLSPTARDDIAADMMLAVLEGDLAISDLQARRKEFERAHWKMFGTIGRISIDAPCHDDSSITIGDRYSDEQYRAFLEEAARA